MMAVMVLSAAYLIPATVWKVRTQVELFLRDSLFCATLGSI